MNKKLIALFKETAYTMISVLLTFIAYLMLSFVYKTALFPFIIEKVYLIIVAIFMPTLFALILFFFKHLFRKRVRGVGYSKDYKIIVIVVVLSIIYYLIDSSKSMFLFAPIYFFENVLNVRIISILVSSVIVLLVYFVYFLYFNRRYNQQ